MIHNHEAICKKLVEQYYGLVPAFTAQVLLHHGVIEVKQALAYSRLSRRDFLKGVDVLARCGLVKINIVKRMILLEIIPENINNMLYYPHYLALVNKHYNTEAGLLLKSVITYGSLSLNELIEWTMFHFIKNNASEWNDNQIDKCIDVLLQAFSLLKKDKILINTNGNSSDGGQIDKEKINQSLGQKLQLEAEETSLHVVGLQVEPRWTLNIDALNCRLFIELFPFFINQPFESAQAMDILNILLETHFENVATINKQNSIFLKDIFNKYQQKHRDQNLVITKFENLLNVYSHFFVPGFIKFEKGNHISLRFDSILFDITKIIVKEFIKKNFGDNSIKIFGALLDEPRIMENTLLNLLKISSKELHQSIYRLDKCRMIEIALFAEPNQQSAFNTKNIKKVFSVNLENVVGCILKRCYYTLYTLLSRKHLEMSEQSDLIQRKKHIESYKADIISEIKDEEEKSSLIQAAHNFMSEKDHQQSEKLIAYDKKGNMVEYDLVNYVFLFNMFLKNQPKTTVNFDAE